MMNRFMYRMLAEARHPWNISMIKSIISSSKKKWQRLSTYSGSRRLSWFSLVLLFGLDIYVLSLTFNGIYTAAETIEIPELAISASCQRMSESFLTLDAKEKAESLYGYVLTTDYNGEDALADFDYSGRQTLPVCAQVREHLLSLVSNKELVSLFVDIAQRQREIENIRTELDELKDSYSEALLEKIAKQRREDSILPAEASQIKTIIAQKNTELTRLESKQMKVQSAIENHLQIKTYVDAIMALPLAVEFGRARQEYEQLAFWYPIKVSAVKLAFILPLLLLAILWNLRALKKQNDTQILISSHLVLVFAVPIFARLFYFMYELLPHHILGAFIAHLQELDLGFLWNYIAIFGGIGGGLLIIFIAQKTFFNQVRLRAARLRKVLCRECGEKLRSTDQACCEMCGTNQLGICPHCGQSHRLLAFHCNHCGTALTALVNKC